MRLNQWIYKAGEEPRMINRDDLPDYPGWITRPIKDEPEEKPNDSTDDYFSLTQQATDLGIKVDGRWGESRIREEITKTQDKAEV